MSSNDDWWNTLKRLLGLIPQGGSEIQSGTLKQPDTVPPNLNETYTSSMSYLSSGAADFRESLGNPDFYYIDNSVSPSELRQIDTSRIAVFKRAYNDGSVTIAFYDYGTNSLVYPRNVQFNANVVESPSRPGEYVIRNGGSTNGTDPNNAIWNGGSPLVAMGVMASSVASSAGNTPVPDPRPESRNYDSTALGKLVFRQMVGHNSVVYTGQVIVRQWQLEDGGYFANFYSPDGTLLSVGTAQGSGAPDIFSMYKTKDVNGKLQRGLYIAPGGKDVFGLLQDSFSGEAPVQPPRRTRSVILYETRNLKYSLVRADGLSYTGNQFHVTYYYNPFNRAYQITFTDMDGKVLSLQGTPSSLPPIENGRYQMPWIEGKTFEQQFESSFGGTPSPEPPSPPSGNQQFQTDTNDYSLSFSRNGESYRGRITVIYALQGKPPDWAFRVTEFGTNNILTVKGDGVNIAGRTPGGPYYSLGYEDGTSFTDTFKAKYGGAPPDGPPPVPPAELKKIEIELNWGQTAIEAFNWDGRTSTPARSFIIHLEEQADGSYQVYATGGSSDPNHNVGGHLWVNLSTTGLRLNRLENGNWEIPANIINRRLSDPTAENVRHWFMQAYHKPPDPTPSPTPTPVDPSKPKSMGTINSADYAILWLRADGSHYEGVVNGSYIEARTSDGKRVVYFTDSDGNSLQAHVPDGFSGWDPTIAPQPTHGRRPITDVQYEVPDDITNFNAAQQWFNNGCDVHGNAPPIPFGDSGLKVDGFILYADEMEAFGVQDKIPDELKDAGVIGFINYDGEYEKKEERLGFVPLPDQPRGGGDIFDRPEVAEPEPERPASPTPEDEPAELVDEEPRELALEYDRLEESFDEKEWISAKAVFAEQAYKSPDKRPEDVFGMQYIPDLSNERLALYVHPNSKQGVVALRGTQSAVDFLSDLFVLIGVPGLSSRYSVTKDELADIKERYPDMKFELIGHSLGGTITSELADEESVWRALGISTGHSTSAKGRIGSTGIGAAIGTLGGLHIAHKSGEDLTKLSAGFFDNQLAAHFERVGITLENAPQDFGLTQEAAVNLMPLFYKLQDVAEQGLNPIIADRGTRAMANHLMQTVDARGTLIENLIAIGRRYPAREAEVALTINHNLAANRETLQVLAGLEQVLLSRLGPAEIRMMEQTAEEVLGFHSRDIVRSGLDAFLRGNDPQVAMERHISAMSNTQRAGFFREIGHPELIPGLGTKAWNTVKGFVGGYLASVALMKILGLGAQAMGIRDYPLDKPKPEDTKVKDWLYGHGGKFTTVRGKNDILSSPDLLQLWLDDNENVRNIDLDSGILGTGADHPLSNFIIKEHEKFKRQRAKRVGNLRGRQGFGDDLGFLQLSDLEFIAKVLKKIPGKRESEQL